MEEVPSGDDWLSPAELRVLGRLEFAPRRASWRLGRWAAKGALVHELGPLEPCRLGILAAEDGAPEPFLDGRPINRTLSLSHRDGRAVAVIAEGPLGVDLESVEPRSGTFLETFFTAGERARVRDAAEPSLVTALTWSAKESALKRLREGLRRDTRSVRVELDDDLGSDGWRPLSVIDEVSAARWPGWWRQVDALVLTVVGEAASAPPSRYL